MCIVHYDVIIYFTLQKSIHSFLYVEAAQTLHFVIYRDGTRLFSGIPESRKSPGILEKGKKFWNLEKLKESYNSNF